MNESVQEFLARQGYTFRKLVSRAIIVEYRSQSWKYSSMIEARKSTLEHYLDGEMGRWWQLFGGTIPFAQYLDASVVADIQQALAYWQALNDK